MHFLPIFPPLSVIWNRLDRTRSSGLARPTGGQMVRQFADGETQGIFPCHGKPVRRDGLADVYSNRSFHRAFEVPNKIGRHLAPMRETAPDPFRMREQ